MFLKKMFNLLFVLLNFILINYGARIIVKLFTRELIRDLKVSENKNAKKVAKSWKFFLAGKIKGSNFEEWVGDFLELRSLLKKQGYKKRHIYQYMIAQVASMLFFLIVIKMREKLFKIFKRQIDE